RNNDFVSGFETVKHNVVIAVELTNLDLLLMSHALSAAILRDIDEELPANTGYRQYRHFNALVRSPDHARMHELRGAQNSIVVRHRGFYQHRLRLAVDLRRDKRDLSLGNGSALVAKDLDLFSHFEIGGPFDWYLNVRLQTSRLVDRGEQGRRRHAVANMNRNISYHPSHRRYNFVVMKLCFLFVDGRLQCRELRFGGIEIGARLIKFRLANDSSCSKLRGAIVLLLRPLKIRLLRGGARLLIADRRLLLHRIDLHQRLAGIHML